MNQTRLHWWIQALRPAQWLKNGVVPAAYFFARWDASQQTYITGWMPLMRIGLITLCFCMVSSGVYLINDIHDLEADRAHPLKCQRPLARSVISVPKAWIAALVLLILGTGSAALCLPLPSVTVLCCYLMMQLGYTFFLKRIAYVDVLLIATGFVLRALAGATTLAVRISPWLLLCTFLLALFLALCKRRHEKLLLDEQQGASHRVALTSYSRYLLDLQIAMTAAATLVAYAIYTLSEETTQRFKTNRLGLTIPLVVFGLFRYMELVYHHDRGGQPEKVLLTDRRLIAVILAYLIVSLLIFITA